MNELFSIAIFAVPLVLAITLHEAAHGYVARYFGDHTASDRGRISLNPLKHIDLVGTILLPGLLLLTHAPFLFGYAKPVPVDPRQMRRPLHDMMWVAAAGPGMNLLLATLSALALAPVTGLAAVPWLHQLLWFSFEINLVLAVLNLLPIPPLDGSKVLAGLLPLELARPYVQLNRFGMLIVLILFVVLPTLGLSIFPWAVGRPVDFIERSVATLLGIKA
jgi:Zn-dependent protease